MPASYNVTDKGIGKTLKQNRRSKLCLPLTNIDKEKRDERYILVCLSNLHLLACIWVSDILKWPREYKKSTDR